MSNQSRYFQISKFLLVGITTALIYFSALWVALNIFSFPEWICISIGFLLSTTFQFLANKFFTFENSPNFYLAQVAKYFVVLTINYLLTMITVGFFSKSVGPYMSVCFALVLTTSVGFLLSRFWVFR